ncbi:hypothetical protein [Cupriavidus metallidurans]|uniref:hypothetical protein n=1 Tax=Cupriavidus metallidurans TaxID=119219 RepID=UPI00190F8B23|nr:hypothetical protein [Cupriavidus metallidurans]
MITSALLAQMPACSCVNFRVLIALTFVVLSEVDITQQTAIWQSTGKKRAPLGALEGVKQGFLPA